MTSLAQTLYQIAEIQESIEDNDGVIDDSLLPVLTEKESLVANNIDKYVYTIESIQALIQQKKNLIEQNRMISKQLDKSEMILKENVKMLMEHFNMKELHGNTRKIKLVNSGGKEAIQYEEDFFVIEKGINKKYIREIPFDLYEKKEIYILKAEKFREYLEQQSLECAHIVPRGKYIKII